MIFDFATTAVGCRVEQETVVKLFVACGDDIAAQDRSGNTELIPAAKSGRCRWWHCYWPERGPQFQRPCCQNQHSSAQACINNSSHSPIISGTADETKSPMRHSQSWPRGI